MKRKVISFLFGLMLIFGVMGCEPYASEGLFVGSWESAGLMSSTYSIYKDNTWSWHYLGLIGESGKWVHNGDRTITLINEDDNEEIIAEYYSDKIYEKDEEGNVIDTWDYTVEEYLLINGTKYYKE